MRLDRAGIEFIKALEGYSATPYRDCAGVWTIGHGHTEGVTSQHPVLTRDQAEYVLLEDLEEFEQGVLKLVSIDLSMSEFTALVSFAYNVGLPKFEKSTLLQKINMGDKIGASKEFAKWVHFKDSETGKSVVSNGLQNRRQKEAALFVQDTFVKKSEASEA